MRGQEFLMIGNFRTTVRGYGGGSGVKMLLQRTWVLLPDPTWWLITSCNLQFQGIQCPLLKLEGIHIKISKSCGKKILSGSKPVHQPFLTLVFFPAESNTKLFFLHQCHQSLELVLKN